MFKAALIISILLSAFCSANEEIIDLLKKWPQDFNAKNIDEVCGLFAPDLVAAYQGAPDRNYEEMCLSLTSILSDKTKTFTYDEPVIEQVIVQGDMAVVRLIWHLTVFDADKKPIESIKERGLDVFKRQKNGRWKIAISYAYTL